MDHPSSRRPDDDLDPWLERQTLRLLGSFLPRSVRQRQINEWQDHLQCTHATNGDSRRELAQVVRSTPSIAWTAAPSFLRIAVPSIAVAAMAALALWPAGRTPLSFSDAEDGLALTYPGSWRELPSSDPEVRLLAAADPSASLLLRVTTDVEPETLTSVCQFTHTLLAADQRTRQLSPPEPISLGGMVGCRHRYAYLSQDGDAGAHDHYFLFKPGKMIQLVLQAVPATSLAAAEPTFERIVATLRSTGR